MKWTYLHRTSFQTKFLDLHICSMRPNVRDLHLQLQDVRSNSWNTPQLSSSGHTHSQYEDDLTKLGFTALQSASDSHWHLHWHSVWLSTLTNESVYLAESSVWKSMMPTFCKRTSCDFTGSHFSFVGQQPSHRCMFMQGGKANWLDVKFTINGFDMHTGLGSHLPGVASFTSPAIIDAGPLPTRPIIDDGLLIFSSNKKFLFVCLLSFTTTKNASISYPI